MRNFNVWKLERKWRNKGSSKKQQPDSGIHDISAHCPHMYQVSIFQASQFLRKVWWKISMLKIGEKEKWIKGWISSSRLIPVYMIHLPTVHVCTNFQSSRPHSSREKWQKISMLKIGEREKWRNKGTNEEQQPDSGIHDTSAHFPRVYQVSI